MAKFLTPEGLMDSLCNTKNEYARAGVGHAEDESQPLG